VLASRPLARSAEKGYRIDGANEKTTENQHNRSAVPLRAREGDPPCDAKREGVQERVLAPGV